MRADRRREKGDIAWDRLESLSESGTRLGHAWLKIKAAKQQVNPNGTWKRALDTRSSWRGRLYKSPSSPSTLSFSPTPSPTMSSIVYRQYTGERDLPHIISLVEHELSEPYVIYTYRYFLNQWCVSFCPRPQPNNSLYPRPHLSFLVSSIPNTPCHYHISPRVNVLSTPALYRLTRMTVLTSPSAV